MTLPILSTTTSSAQTTFTAPTYSITTNSTNVNKNNTVIFTVNTTNVANGTVLYWTNAGTSVNSDFTDNLGSGSFTITNNTGSISRTLIDNVVVEGKTIILDLRTTSISGPIQASSPTVNIIAAGPSATYSITADKYTTQPGTVVNFTITTTNVPNGTTLYLTYSGTAYPAGVVVQTNDFTILNNVNNSPAYVQFSSSITAGQTLTTSVRTGSVGGPIVASLTQNITISPTSSISDNVISNLFTGGVEGFWYDPSDLSTIFADYNGTPATLNSFVRLILDKSKGLALGPERIVNGNFSDTSAWIKGSPTSQNGTITVQNNKLLIDYPSGAGQLFYAYQSLANNGTALEPFKVYKLTCTISDYVRGGISFSAYNDNIESNVWGCPRTTNGLAGSLTGNGNFTCYMVIVKTNLQINTTISQQPNLNYFQIFLEGGAKLSLSNLSVKEIKGNHAFTWPPYKTTTGDHPPRLSARVNLLRSTDSWTTGTQQTINIGSTDTYDTYYQPYPKQNGRQQLKLTFSGAGTVKLTYVGSTSTNYTTGTHVIPLPNNISAINIECISGTVTNIDLRYGKFGTSIPSYQRVNTDTDYETSNFPYYLQFGTDFVNPPATELSALFTNQKVFTTSPNKLTTWAGITSTKNVMEGNILYSSPVPDARQWAVISPTAVIPSIWFKTNLSVLFFLGGYHLLPGDTPQTATTAIPTAGTLNFAFPWTYIVQAYYNWLDQTPNCISFKINGLTPSVNSGTGYLLNQLVGPLRPEMTFSIGTYYYDPLEGQPRRDSLFQGKLFAMIARGAESTPTEIANVGQWISNKMGGGFYT